MRQIPVGLVGYGFSSSVFHAPLINAVPGLRLQRIASHEPQAATRDYPEVAVDTDSDAMLADPAIELVVIATPNDSHFPLARAALLAGKHVVLDKPFVLTVQEGRQLIDLAKASGLLLSVFHNRRWDNDFLTVRRCIDSGMLGAVHTYEAHYDRFVPQVDGRWRERAAPGAGVLFDLGSHLIDQALQLFGLPRTVFADLACQRDGAQVDDYFHLMLDYGAVKVVLHAGMLVCEPGPHHQVHGTQGSFIKYGLDSQEAALLRGERPGHPHWGRDDAAQNGRLTFESNGLQIAGAVESVAGSYEAYYRGVQAALADGQACPVDPEDALNVIKVIEYAVRSHEQKRVLDFI